MTTAFETTWKILFNFDRQKTSVTHRKILSFKDLEQGWCYGRGAPFKQEDLDKASQLLSHLNNLGFFETDAFPSENGDVMLTVYRGEYYCEVLVRHDGVYDFTSEKNDEELHEEEGVELSVIEGLLEKFRDKVSCESSERSTRNTMIIKRKDITALLSKTPVVMTVGYQLFPKNASMETRDAFVNTYHNTTQRSQDSPLYFGASTRAA